MKEHPFAKVVAVMLCAATVLAISYCTEHGTAHEQARTNPLPALSPSTEFTQPSPTNTPLRTLLPTSTITKPTPTNTPQPAFASPTKPNLDQVCHQPFRNMIDWTDANWEGDTIYNLASKAEAVIPQLIQVSEMYLNECVDSDIPLSEQDAALSNMSYLAQMLAPPDKIASDCDCAPYCPQVLPAELDSDGTEELVLNTSLICAQQGALSIVYDLNENTGTWHGTLVWPASASEFGPPRTRDPLIRLLEIRGANEHFVLVVGDVCLASSSARFIRIWRWVENNLEAALEIRLSNWCGLGQLAWEITEDGYILIPAVEANHRCEARQAVVYFLQGDKFVAGQP